MFVSLLLLSIIVWVTDRRKETPEDVLDQAYRGWISVSAASGRIRQMDGDVYALLAAEMEVKDGYLRSKYIAVYPKLPEWMKDEQTRPFSDMERHDRAKHIVGNFLDAEGDLRNVMNELGREHPEVRKQACRALYWRRFRQGVIVDESWPQDVLIKYLNSQNEVVRDFVLHKFKEIGEKSIVAQTNFTRFLHHRDEEVVLDAALTIRATGGDVGQLKPVLEKLAGSSSDVVRYQAATTLGELDRRNVASMVTLVSFAQSTNAVYRAPALSQLSFFGTNAAAHSMTVKSLFSDPDPDVRQAATNTFYSLNPDINSEMPYTGTVWFSTLSEGSRYLRRHLVY